MLVEKGIDPVPIVSDFGGRIEVTFPDEFDVAIVFPDDLTTVQEEE